VQVGQGFFVLAAQNGSTFSFTPGMRRHNSTVSMLKSTSRESAWSGLQLKAKSGADANYTTIVFNKSMTSGLDPGYDVGILSSGSGVEIYTTLAEDNGINFTRQALPEPGCDTTVIALGVDSRDGGEVTFSAFTRPLPDHTFYLEDRETGVFTDLSKGSYKAILAQKTTGTGRFYVSIVPVGKSSRRQPSAEPEMKNIRIWAAAGKINIQGDVSNAATAEVYNLQGSKVLVTKLNESSYNSFEMTYGAKGVYVIVVKDGQKVYNQKVVFI
jgi:hypothetical protein